MRPGGRDNHPRLRSRSFAPIAILRCNGLEISLVSSKFITDDLSLQQASGFGPHRLMLRPRESRDLRLISSKVTTTPESVVTWAYDVLGNAVATVTFQAMTIISSSTVSQNSNSTQSPGLSSILPPLQLSTRSGIRMMSGPTSAL